MIGFHFDDVVAADQQRSHIAHIKNNNQKKKESKIKTKLNSYNNSKTKESQTAAYSAMTSTVPQPPTTEVHQGGASNKY